ncbi:DEAD/DEAH box helicase family protein [Peribacillus frigoritolerans]|nr:DEAD/DEAH box helicase family protein [Peribacillus frigoritolerans]
MVRIRVFSFFREEVPKTDGFKEISEEEVCYVLKDNRYNESIIQQPEFQINMDKFTPCNSFITSFFSIERIMFFLEYGIAYIDEVVPEKQIIRYPQFFALQNIIKRLENGGKTGVIWHTQGSGKTNLAAYSNRLIRDYYYKNEITAKFYFVVDRLDLLTQAKGEFKKIWIECY